MELTHSFTVPSSVDTTWEHFQDIGALAECFPGAQVTSVGEADGAPTFEGTCKVKLGPIALVYAGSGTFVERDDEAHRFVVEAKGRDKRGNGTAGATVTLSMQETGDGTAVDVLTELSVTGKPAQFGRGVMQDVSDKLLGQFVGCLEERLASDGGGADPGTEAVPAADTVEAADTSAETSAETTAETTAETSPAEAPAAAEAPATAPSEPAAEAPAARHAKPSADDSLDLGATVLPVLVNAYGKQVAAAVLGLLGLFIVLRALRGRRG
jgi:carbon monoxide dehydrogenase subunit G